MAHDITTVAVLGAGSWGTALAILLAGNGHASRIWAYKPTTVERLRTHRENIDYLPGITFPPGMQIDDSLALILEKASLILVAVPCHAYLETLRQIHRYLLPEQGLVWATKGLEPGSGRFLHQVTNQILGHKHATAVISGPNFAREVAAGFPTAITVASQDTDFAHRVASLLHGPTMRAYTSQDVIGVELGGAIKNVLAIATGVADGLGFGANTRAALITRGLAELVRLGEAVGGQRETFMGLAGVGDLVLTCTDDQSRNRRLGLAIGQGYTLSEALVMIGQVVEGVPTTREVMRLARSQRVEMPITQQVHGILYQDLSPKQAVENLLTRDLKPEAP